AVCPASLQYCGIAPPTSGWLGTWLVFCSATADIAAVIVSTPAELIVEIGKVAKLPCKFTSSEKITTAASATWSYRKRGTDDRPITVRVNA
uniref:Immunoglobulin V-set domain-containing protein n=1 Tax=Podarcis muralis TaxID=64176 RepID=A0A670ISE1_PODMU